MTSFVAAWAKRKPAFTVRITVDGHAGSGLMIDERHAITCAHVVDRGGPQAWRPTARGLLERWQEEAWPITVLCDGLGSAAEPIAQPAGLDLVLLRLGRSFRGIRSPLSRRWSPEMRPPSKAWVIGHPEGAAETDAVLSELVYGVTRSTRLIGGEAQDAVFVNGPPPGSSGAGVFAEAGGDPIFLGLVTMGGDASPRGRMILPEAIDRMLADHGLSLPPVPSAGTLRMQRLAWEGIDAAPRSIERVSGGRIDFVPVPVGLDDTIAEPFLIAAQPVSGLLAAHMLDLRSDQFEQRWRAVDLPFDTVERVLERLRDDLQRDDLDLPTPAQLALAWHCGEVLVANRAGQSEPGVEPHRRNSWGIAVPPIGCGEWVRAPECNALRINWAESGAISRPVRLDAARGWPYVGFRLAMSGLIG